MIKGFTQTALVVYPYYEQYSGRGSQYYQHINKAAENVKAYLNECGIKTASFITDDVARELPFNPDIWIQPMGSGDMHFVRQYCVGMDREYQNTKAYNEIVQEVMQKYPNVKGMSVDRRFELVLKRSEAAQRKILKEFKLLVLFKPTMQYTPKKGNNVLSIIIENSSFLSKTFISDMEENPIDLLGIKNGNMPVYEWEV